MGSFQSKNEWTSEGKNVLITGASSGIGLELAKQFAKQGASLALLARSKDTLAKVADECIALGSPRAEIFVCDLTNEADIKKSMESIKDTMGTLDVVILNAGRSQGCYFEEIKDVDSIGYMIKLNVTSVISCLHFILPIVPKSSSSRIVFISSVAGLIGVPYRTIYCSSKHAMAGFVNALRIELLDTYGKDSPAVQLINFPEVKGTSLNAGRMDFGADLPPAQFKEGAILEVKQACTMLLEQIALGAREWGQPFKFKVLIPLRGLIADVLDKIILKTVKKTHFRPVIA